MPIAIALANQEESGAEPTPYARDLCTAARGLAVPGLVVFGVAVLSVAVFGVAVFGVAVLGLVVFGVGHGP